VTEALRASLAAVPTPPLVVVVGAGRADVADGEVDYAAVHDEPRLRTVAEVTFTDVNCVIYTSGTTGPSKGVPLTNAHGVHKAFEVNRVCQMSSDDVIYSPLPLFHSMALLRGVLAAVVSGGECVLRDRFSASEYWDDVRRHGATIGHCVFTIPQILKKAPPSADDRDHPLRCLYQGRYDAEFEERFGVRLIEGYGLTEAGVATYVRADEPPRPGSCGRVADEWEVQLVDEHDLPVAVGEVGEIVLRPRLPWLVTPGYLNKPEATAAAFRNLWFHTGDLATVDADGYYYFKDRKKDSMRRRGENVSSWELEQVIRELPAVDEAAATPYPSPLGEDEIRVFVTLLPEETLSPEQVVAHCERRLPGFMVPRYVEILDALPRTPTGRIQKYELRSRPLGPDHHDAGDRGEAARRVRHERREPAS
jgi:crotonobetaine/carnitine-CoA ligase